MKLKENLEETQCRPFPLSPVPPFLWPVLLSAFNGTSFRIRVFRRSPNRTLSLARKWQNISLQNISTGCQSASVSFAEPQTAPSFAESLEQAQQATVTFKIAFVITDKKNTQSTKQSKKTWEEKILTWILICFCKQ